MHIWFIHNKSYRIYLLITPKSGCEYPMFLLTNNHQYSIAVSYSEIFDVTVYAWFKLEYKIGKIIIPDFVNYTPKSILSIEIRINAHKIRDLSCHQWLIYALSLNIKKTNYLKLLQTTVIKQNNSSYQLFCGLLSLFWLFSKMNNFLNWIIFKIESFSRLNHFLD